MNETENQITSDKKFLLRPHLTKVILENELHCYSLAISQVFGAFFCAIVDVIGSWDLILVVDVYKVFPKEISKVFSYSVVLLN